MAQCTKKEENKQKDQGFPSGAEIVLNMPKVLQIAVRDKMCTIKFQPTLSRDLKYQNLRP